MTDVILVKIFGYTDTTTNRVVEFLFRAYTPSLSRFNRLFGTMKAATNLSLRLHQSSRQITTTRSRFAPFTRQIRPIVYSPAANRRQYSSAVGEKQQESSSPEKPQASPEKDTRIDDSAVDPAKKELEANRREIIDLKVEIYMCYVHYRAQHVS